jgi:hypothetical protein
MAKYDFSKSFGGQERAKTIFEQTKEGYDNVLLLLNIPL